MVSRWGISARHVTLALLACLPPADPDDVEQLVYSAVRTDGRHTQALMRNATHPALEKINYKLHGHLQESEGAGSCANG